MSDKFLRAVNEITKAEHGKVVSLNNALIEAQLDSFSWLVFWLELDKVYPNIFTDEFINEIDYKKTKFKDLAQMVKDDKNIKE